MNCWHCNTDLIWNGDNDIDDEVYQMETNLTCPKCGAFYCVYLPHEPHPPKTESN